MATIEVGRHLLGFRSTPLVTMMMMISPLYRPRLHFRKAFVVQSRSRSRRVVLGIRAPSCSLVGEQKKEEEEEEEEEEERALFNEQESSLIEALIGIQGRGRSASPRQLQEVERAVKVLEGLEAVPDPRTFVGVDFFSIFQEVYLRKDDPRVNNIVRFSDAIGELKVEAAASIKDGKRILFQFDRAAFSFKFLPFKVPYPVPFKLLGDEAKGWLDTTYLSHSGNLRVSRGNKGTTFVLQKKAEPRQMLLKAISSDKGVQEAIDEFISLNKNSNSELELIEGEWQMIWSSQMETDSWIENAANGLMGLQIVRPNGKLKFLVNILLGLRFSIDGTFEKCGSNTYDVVMDDAAILASQFGLPVEMQSKFKLELLYTDEKIRITRGYNNITFVHLRNDVGGGYNYNK
ncbi:probable plastid-lipid-associated protein 12, chloroplastic isoform X2 [Diospyros lotus]|uniref:probable plastid-lipid-associated protein 12, chloroplastic isoform X2 n=1 Tax=Diospyros lotus TaxID=55363 RepID=UPI00224E6071|nr:probable plastid-lipid-associated protein 12, chloroplastic isoform X2 [Diospyros lotus]